MVSFLIATAESKVRTGLISFVLGYLIFYPGIENLFSHTRSGFPLFLPMCDHSISHAHASHHSMLGHHRLNGVLLAGR